MYNLTTPPQMFCCVFILLKRSQKKVNLYTILVLLSIFTVNPLILNSTKFRSTYPQRYNKLYRGLRIKCGLLWVVNKKETNNWMIRDIDTIFDLI